MSYKEEACSSDEITVVVDFGNMTSKWHLGSSDLLCEKPEVRERVTLDMTIEVSIV